MGQAHYVESSRSIVWAEDGPVVVFGLENLVVVQSRGVTLVTSRDRARDLKQLLAALPQGLREGGPTTAEGTARTPEDDRSDREDDR
jgi:mannose-1-phosphate guanylyltransferase